MTWIDWLERRFGRFAIPGLIRLVVAFNALVFVLLQFNPTYAEALDLRPDKVMGGEVWRLFTYAFIPPTDSLLFILFALLFLWMLGEGLEQAWGSFRLNLFYLMGMIGCTVAAFYFGGGSTTVFLNLSILLAFATVFPEYPILLFFVLPIKIKWLAWFSAAGVGVAFLEGGWGTRMVVLASLANYLLFFGPALVRAAKERRETGARRRRFEERSAPAEEVLHRCAVCGRSDASDPDLEFRVGPDGNDYCTEHLPGSGEKPGDG